MGKKRIILNMLIVIAVFLALSRIFLFQNIRTYQEMAQEMFQLNSRRIAEGYYMAEFEFQMVGILYFLDKGQYKKTFTLFRSLYERLKTGNGLIKVPEFAGPEEALAFYKSLQNPKTGAFMDDSYPLCTYFEPTLNVISHIENLAEYTGQPLKLKYPLTFIEQLDSPAELRAYLDDLAAVGKLVSKMPKTPNVLSSLESYKDLERLNLYTFSPEWKRALVKWLWENQDPETGYWGVRLRNSGTLLKGGDLTNTPKFIKLLVDKQGRNRYEEFPLRYKNEMFKTTIQKLKKTVPESLPEQHVWSIDISRGIRLLTDYLWENLSAEEITVAQKELEKILRIIFSEFYVPAQGAFGLYVKKNTADLDGTAEYLSILKRMGVFSVERQKKLWGFSADKISDLGVFEVSQMTKSDFSSLEYEQDINSIRLYRADPKEDGYFSDIIAVIYPGNTPVIDVVELVPRIDEWIRTTPQNMGNWVSKASLKETLANIDITPVPVIRGDIPFESANAVLRDTRTLTAIGVDVLQIPRCKMKFRIK